MITLPVSGLRTVTEGVMQVRSDSTTVTRLDPYKFPGRIQAEPGVIFAIFSFIFVPAWVRALFFIAAAGFAFGAEGQFGFLF